MFANLTFTLPWLLYQLAGKYAADEAQALAMILMLLTVASFASARFFVSYMLWRGHAQVKDVKFSYANSAKTTFKFDLEVALGNIVVVEGKSGAGKPDVVKSNFWIFNPNLVLFLGLGIA